MLYVTKLIGQSSPAITQSVYQHACKDRLDAAAQAISDAIA